MLNTADKLAINELLGRAAYGLDARDLELLEQCFAADATMLVKIAGHPPVGPFEGRAAIMKLMTDTLAAQTDTRRHVISNIFFETGDAATATVVSVLTLFSVEHGEISVISSGIYRDTVVNSSDGWQFAERLLDLDLPF